MTSPRTPAIKQTRRGSPGSPSSPNPSQTKRREPGGSASPTGTEEEKSTAADEGVSGMPLVAAGRTVNNADGSGGSVRQLSKGLASLSTADLAQTTTKANRKVSVSKISPVAMSVDPVRCGVPHPTVLYRTAPYCTLMH